MSAFAGIADIVNCYYARQKSLNRIGESSVYRTGILAVCSLRLLLFDGARVLPFGSLITSRTL